MRTQSPYELFDYLHQYQGDADEVERLPALSEISQDLGISLSRLREQLEVAKALGFVDARPRVGIRRLPYSFLPAVRQSLNFAIHLDRGFFDTFSDFRNHIEAIYWYEAVQCLTQEDKKGLQDLVEQAWEKLRSARINIPHLEHRQFHLGIYARLNNQFVTGILEAYWEAYEAVGLNAYTGYDYLQQVWTYHQQMADAISAGDLPAGYRALVEHKDLLYHRPVAALIGENVTFNLNGDPGEE